MFNFLSNFTWQTRLIAILALVAIAFAAGWRVHGWKTDAGIARSIAAAEKTRQAAIVSTEKIVNQSQAQQAESKIIYRTIREKINDQNDQRICFADSNALGLWNSAIAGADQHRPGPAGTPNEIGATRDKNGAGDPESDTVATVEQVLTNAAENFQICNENAIKHNALIDAVEVYKGKMCVCQN